MDENKLFLVLLQTKVHVEKVFPLIYCSSLLLLIKKGGRSLTQIFGVQNMWKKLPPLGIYIVVDLKLRDPKLVIQVLIAFNSQELYALHV